jgi:hypothetical protein
VTASAAALLAMAMDVELAWEDEFNHWYNTEHVAQRLACPGFEFVTRYQAVVGEPKYLALYHLEDLAALETDQYKALAARTPWTERVMAHTSNVRRTVYRRIAIHARLDAEGTK